MKTKQAEYWAGEPGEAYIRRNSAIGTRYEDRKSFFDLFKSFNKDSAILEAGCNIGLNLQILQGLGFTNLHGVDIGQKALGIASKSYPNVKFAQADLAELPYEDSQFDVVYTSGVLIHFNPLDALNVAMKEIYRCSKSVILGFEDYGSEFTSKVYTGRGDFYWKGPYVERWLKQFPSLDLKKKSIEHIQGLDRVYYRLDKNSS